MKIDILQQPPADIFKNRGKHTLGFVTLLTLAFIGILLGVYAIFSDTAYYEQLETLALVFFAGPAAFVAYFGEKLQRYKKLTPPQEKELANWIQKYPEIKNYCDQVTKANRQPILCEYEACQNWAEDQRLEANRKSKEQAAS